MPLKAFPGWFLSIRCERCGETRVINEAQTPWQDVRLVYVLRRLRHPRCGGEAARVELQSDVEGGYRRVRVRRIVLREGLTTLIALDSPTEAEENRPLPPAPRAVVSNAAFQRAQYGRSP